MTSPYIQLKKTLIPLSVQENICGGKETSLLYKLIAFISDGAKMSPGSQKLHHLGNFCIKENPVCKDFIA